MIEEERKVKCCPFCQSISIHRNVTKKQYRCDGCGEYFRREQVVFKMYIPQTTRIPLILQKIFENKNRKRDT